jgi:hypothetical protein
MEVQQAQAAIGLDPWVGIAAEAIAVAKSKTLTYPALLQVVVTMQRMACVMRAGYHSSLSSTAFTANAC